MTPSWLHALEAFSEHERVGGELILTSGSIVACDPLVELGAAPVLKRKVAPGPYPVLLGRLEGDVAWARVEFTGQPVARWESAGAHGVDSGTSCFVDAEVRDVESARQKARRDQVFGAVLLRGVDPADAEAWHAAIAEERAKLPDDGFMAAIRHGAVEIGEGTLIAFSSGAGDGRYTTWWGLDAEGQPCTLLTDFDLMQEDDESEELPRVAEAPRQGPAPAFVRALAFVRRLEADDLLEVEEGTSRDVLAEGIMVVLDARQPDPAAIADALFELDGVEELYASDEELLERLK